jgi:hypothetical protein
MSTFFFSGVNRRGLVYLLRGVQAAAMVSFLDCSRSVRWALEDMSLDFAVDSGSYTKPLLPHEIRQYAAFIEQMEGRAAWYAAPDVMSNQEASNENYRYLLSLLPRYQHQYVLWVYQYGSDMAYLREGLREHERIGIGGLVPLITGNPQQAKSAILSIAKIIKEHHVTPHYFGLGSASIIKALRDIHEDFSCDSTTWLLGGKYGIAIDSWGQQRPANEGTGYNWDKDAILRQNARTMQKWINPDAPYSQELLWWEDGE